MRYTMLIAAGFAMAILGAGVVFVYYSPQLFPSRPLVYRSPADSCTGPSGYLLVIADNGGFNGSRSHGAPQTPWPVIQVTKGETLSLLICNQDPTQAHGFAIDHYFDGGIVLGPGAAYKVSFVARDSGVFRIYCYVFCTVHVYMSGQLKVTG